MKIIVILISVLLLVSTVGCTKSIRYTEDEIQKFPQTVQDNIRKGEIALGMTTQQVRYAWGAPDSIKFLEPFENRSREEWIYSTIGIFGTKLLIFYDGKLIYYNN
jgi:outer membrane protein assembly factor BamE (lipoprotein component of BamABCDE complex)